MTRRPALFATWKNQVSLADSLILAGTAVQATVRTDPLFDLSVCPSMAALASVAPVIAGKLPLTAQNMGWDDRHSLTGETSASDLTDIGCRYVIVGHSERRLYLGETDDMIARKLQTAFKHRLIPILCVGDTLEQHQAGGSDEAVQAQLQVLLRVHDRTDGPFVIAYEPTWAISTGDQPRDCGPAEAADRHGFIRALISTELGAEVAAGTTLLYGGSVTAANADGYFRQGDIDGGLIGGASQELASFQALIEASIVTYGAGRPHTSAAASPASGTVAGPRDNLATSGKDHS